MDYRAVSRREREVLDLISAHLSNAQIAGVLHISVRTVENHVSSLLHKYGAADRRSLAIAAGPAPGPEPGPGPGPELPSWRTTFVGRTHERDTVLAMLDQARLLTLTGPGGVGKTRLAAVIGAAAGRPYPAGVCFADLVSVRDGLVIQAVATALNVTERTGQPLEQAVLAQVRAGRRLLILDNCEHVLDEVAGLAERMLSACPDSTILATSRERLGVPGERVIPVSPLPLASDAEALFADRAAAAGLDAGADPALVAAICARLDGVPLAIELAAARCASLGADGLLLALDDSLRALAGGRDRDERHRSLHAVLSWSYDLLNHAERSAFRRLAAFAGGFDIDAAAAVAGGERAQAADLIGRLTDKSLLVCEHASGRWRMLGTIRAFAAGLPGADGELAEVQDRQLAWAASTAAGLRARLSGSWREEFDAVVGDLRATLGRCPAGPAELPHKLARDLGYLTYARRFLTESVGHFTDAASRAPEPARAAADLRAAAQATFAVGIAGGAFELLLAAAERARAAGDADAEAIALADAVITGARYTSGFPEPVPAERLDSLLTRAAGARRAGGAAEPGAAVGGRLRMAAAAADIRRPPAGRDSARAEAAIAAARDGGDPVLLSGGLDLLATAAAEAGEFRRAHELRNEQLSLLDVMDLSHPSAAAERLSTMHGAWLAALAIGDLPGALTLAESYRTDELLGAHPYRSASKLIPPLALMGRFDEVGRLAETMWAAWRRSGTPIAVWLSPAADAAAMALGLGGDDAGFRRWRARASEAAGARGRDPAVAFNIASFGSFADARVAAHTGGGARPAEVVARAFRTPGWHQAYAHAAAAELAVVAGLPGADRYLDAAGPAAGQNQWAAACLARARARFRGDSGSLRESARRWADIEARFERDETLRLAPRRFWGDMSGTAASTAESSRSGETWAWCDHAQHSI